MKQLPRQRFTHMLEALARSLPCLQFNNYKSSSLYMMTEKEAGYKLTANDLRAHAFDTGPYSFQNTSDYFTGVGGKLFLKYLK